MDDLLNGLAALRDPITRPRPPLSDDGQERAFMAVFAHQHMIVPITPSDQPAMPVGQGMMMAPVLSLAAGPMPAPMPDDVGESALPPAAAPITRQEQTVAGTTAAQMAAMQLPTSGPGKDQAPLTESAPVSDPFPAPVPSTMGVAATPVPPVPMTALAEAQTIVPSDAISPKIAHMGEPAPVRRKPAPPAMSEVGAIPSLSRPPVATRGAQVTAHVSTPAPAAPTAPLMGAITDAAYSVTSDRPQTVPPMPDGQEGKKHPTAAPPPVAPSILAEAKTKIAPPPAAVELVPSPGKSERANIATPPDAKGPEPRLPGAAPATGATVPGLVTVGSAPAPDRHLPIMLRDVRLAPPSAAAVAMPPAPISTEFFPLVQQPGPPAIIAAPTAALRAMTQAGPGDAPPQQPPVGMVMPSRAAAPPTGEIMPPPMPGSAAPSLPPAANPPNQPAELSAMQGLAPAPPPPSPVPPGPRLPAAFAPLAVAYAEPGDIGLGFATGTIDPSVPRMGPRLSDPVLLPQSAAQQIVSAAAQLHLAPEGPIDIALDPPELGRVRLSLVEVNGTMTLSILAERPETADLMRRHLSLLTAEFARQGLDTPMVDISGGGQGGRQGRDGELHQTADMAQDPRASAPATPPPPPTRASHAASGLDLRL